ncbi:MAG TPA: AraC family transcriptional regulator [Sphingobium sp.]|nr:AraC family transcriptional regulator [Sphingobium sp.]
MQVAGWENFAEASTRDPCRALHVIGDLICDYKISPLAPTSGMNGRLSGISLDSFAVCYVEFSSNAQVDVCLEEDKVVIHVPLIGASKITVGTSQIDATPSQACVVQRGQKAVTLLNPASRHLIVRLSEEHLERSLAKKLGRQLRAPLQFETQMDLLTTANLNFVNLLHLFLGAVDDKSGLSSLAVPEFEQLLLNQFLIGQPNNYREELLHVPRVRVSAPIAKAAKWITDNAADPMTPEDIASACGLSVRALQDGFRRFHNQTPLEFLRNVRLEKARAALIKADCTTGSVTTIAFESGFQHLGRFASLYKDRYGESPSETLRLSGALN